MFQWWCNGTARVKPRVQLLFAAARTPSISLATAGAASRQRRPCQSATCQREREVVGKTLSRPAATRNLNSRFDTVFALARRRPTRPAHWRRGPKLLTDAADGVAEGASEELVELVGEAKEAEVGVEEAVEETSAAVEGSVLGNFKAAGLPAPTLLVGSVGGCGGSSPAWLLTDWRFQSQCAGPPG